MKGYLGSFKRTVFEATPFIIFTALAELAAGNILVSMNRTLSFLPGILFLLPGLMESRGNISTSLAQRLGSAIHLGLISWEDKVNEELRENIYATFFLSLMVNSVYVFLCYGFMFFFRIVNIGLFWLLIISLATTILSCLTQIFLTVTISLYFSYKGFDPDNVTIPIVATIGDLLTVFYLILVSSLTINFLV